MFGTLLRKSFESLICLMFVVPVLYCLPISPLGLFQHGFTNTILSAAKTGFRENFGRKNQPNRASLSRKKQVEQFPMATSKETLPAGGISSKIWKSCGS